MGLMYKFTFPIIEGRPKYAVIQVQGEEFLWTEEHGVSVYRSNVPHLELDEFADVTVFGRKKNIKSQDDTEPVEVPEDVQDEIVLPEHWRIPAIEEDARTVKGEDTSAGIPKPPEPEDTEEEETVYTKVELNEMKRSELDNIAEDLEIDPAAYSNKTKVINAILKAQKKK